jgi:hypothetical protein
MGTISDVTTIGYGLFDREGIGATDPNEESFAGNQVLTFNDILDSLLMSYDIEADSRHFYIGKRAVQSAYRDFPSKHQWSYLKRRMMIVTRPSQGGEQGTYKHDTRLLYMPDLAAPLPADARYFNVVFGNDAFEVEERISDYELRLHKWNNPGEDRLTGEPYWVYKSQYSLPPEFVRSEPLFELANNYFPTYCNPTQALEAMAGRYRPQRPTAYTIRSNDRRMGRMMVEFIPPPVERRTYDSIIEVMPRTLKRYRYDTGMATIAQSSDLVTLTGAGVVSTDMENSIIRLGTNTDFPGGPYGLFIGGDNEIAYEGFITEVITSTNQLRVSPLPAAGHSNVKYVISDPIDIWPQAAENYFEMLVDEYFAARTNRRDLAPKKQQSMIALREAMGADRPFRGMYRDGAFGFSKLEDYALSEPIKDGAPI